MPEYSIHVNSLMNLFLYTAFILPIFNRGKFNLEQSHMDIFPLIVVGKIYPVFVLFSCCKPWTRIQSFSFVLSSRNRSLNAGTRAVPSMLLSIPVHSLCQIRWKISVAGNLVYIARLLLFTLSSEISPEKCNNPILISPPRLSSSLL